MSARSAAWGSALFFLLAPGVMAGLIPWLITGWEDREPAIGFRLLGIALLLEGAALVVAAFVRFVREGGGTPAPVAPTSELVVGGVYRWVRNPMYVAVTAIIAGQSLFLGDRGLLLYAALFLAVTYCFVALHEEPALRRRYGEQYEAYRAAVPGWLPRPPG